MTLVSLPSPVLFPGILMGVIGVPGLGTVATLDASGEYVAYVFCAREDMTISHVGFRAGTVANAPTADVRIETLDGTTGLPSGTLWNSPTDTTSGTSATITSNSNPLVALTAAASITKGQVFCVKIVWGGVATSTLIIQDFSIPAPSSNLPYRVINTGTPTKSLMQTALATLALGSNSTTFYQVPASLPVSSNANNTFNNTNSARRGLKFTPPMKCRAIGLRWHNSSQVGDFNAVIFDDAGTPLEFGNSSTAFEGDNSGASASGTISVYFDNAVTLSAGTTYRAVIEPTSATNLNISTVTLPSADYYGATPGRSTATYTTYVASTWTDSTTQIPLMDVILDQLDDGAGSGGVVGVIGG